MRRDSPRPVRTERLMTVVAIYERKCFFSARKVLFYHGEKGQISETEIISTVYTHTYAYVY